MKVFKDPQERKEYAKQEFVSVLQEYKKQPNKFNRTKVLIYAAAYGIDKQHYEPTFNSIKIQDEKTIYA